MGLKGVKFNLFVALSVICIRGKSHLGPDTSEVHIRFSSVDATYLYDILDKCFSSRRKGLDILIEGFDIENTSHYSKTLIKKKA